MDRKEAIFRIKDHIEHHGIDKYPHLKLKEALDMAITALRGPTREMVERMREEWKCQGDCGVTECSACGWNIEQYVGDYNFCPSCGAPMTDEAVDMMLERWRR